MDPKHQVPALQGHESYVYPVRYTPDGKWIASGSWDCTVRLWDAKTGLECSIIRHPSRVLDLAIGPDSNWLATGCGDDDLIRIWSISSGALLKEIKGPGKWIVSLAVSPDGARIAAVNNFGKAGVYDLASGGCINPISGVNHKRIAYDPMGRWLGVSQGRKLSLLDLREPDRSIDLETAATALAFSADGRLLMTTGVDRTISVWDLETARCRMIMRGHTDAIFTLAIHPEGRRVATAGRDGTIRLWECESGEEVARLKGHRNYVWSLAFSPDGKTLASGSGDGTVRLWDTEPASHRHRAQRDAEALRRKAEKLVEQLSRQCKGRDEVAEAIRSDQILDEPLRSAALAAILRQATRPSASPSDVDRLR
jgi:WD40 repeat protein